MKRHLIFNMAIVMGICACNCSPENGTQGGDPLVPPQTEADVVMYTTTADMGTLFRKSGIRSGSADNSSLYSVKFDESSASGEVDGFGLAVTTASCFNLLCMDAADRTAFLENMFSREKGIGSSLIRLSMGASDFCIKDEYTWCDKPGLENFAVHEEDKNYLFPILREIYSINPDVKIIASPWSCPRWMKCEMPGGNDWDASKYNVAVTQEKDYDSWTGGRLKPSCYEVYAEYMVKWVQTMKAEGFDIYALTLQNEPLNAGNSMSLVMPWQDQKEYIKLLGPAMEKAGLGDVKLLLFDHNFNYDNKSGQTDYPMNVYADPEAYRWAAGSAWHDYGGSVSELDKVVGRYPEKQVFFTEASIGEWNYSMPGERMMSDFQNLFMGVMKRGGRGVTLWNLMLDQNHGPHSRHDGACTTCHGGVTINSSNYKTVTRNSHWYDVAHCSAVIKPGAKKLPIEAKLPSAIECQMFLNPDGSVGAILLSRNSSSQSVLFKDEKSSFRCIVEPNSITSLLWNRTTL